MTFSKAHPSTLDKVSNFLYYDFKKNFLPIKDTCFSKKNER